MEVGWVKQRKWGQFTGNQPTNIPLACLAFGEAGASIRVAGQDGDNGGWAFEGRLGRHQTWLECGTVWVGVAYLWF